MKKEYALTPPTADRADYYYRLKRQALMALQHPERSNAKTLWARITNYINPNDPANFWSDSLNMTRGGKTTQWVMESMPIQANYDLACAINSTLTNPAQIWSKLKIKDKQLMSNASVNEWLEEVNGEIHSQFNDSNLYQQLHKGYQSLTSLGNMAIMHEVKRKADGTFDGFQFTAIHISQLAWRENANGSIDTIFRHFPMTAEQIIEKWPESATDEMKECCESDPTREFAVIHCVLPQSPNDIKYNTFHLADEKNRPYLSVYMLEEKEQILEESGYYELPIFVCRWSVGCAEQYGRGPGTIALPDVASLNLMKMQSHQSGALALAPPILALQRNIVSNVIEWKPRGITYVKSMEGFKEFNTGARFDVGDKQREELYASISKIFLLDKLQLPPRTETGEMTAYEVSQRIEQMQRVLGPTLNRLNSELLNPLIERSYAILQREGLLPPVPSALVGKDIDVDISFVNQLARAQSMEEVSNVQRWLQNVGMMAQMDPSVIDTVNFDAIASMMANVEGVELSLLNTPDTIKQIRNARAQQQQQQAQAEMQLKQADANSKNASAAKHSGGMQGQAGLPPAGTSNPMGGLS